MFKDIGKQIKTLTKIVFWVETVGFLLAGVSFLASGNFLGIAFFLVGPIVAWISNMLLYGFGELIDKTESIERKLNEESRNLIQEDKEQEPLSNTNA